MLAGSYRLDMTLLAMNMSRYVNGVAKRHAEVSRALPGLQDALGTCGLTVLGRATAAQLAAVVRTAYDPAMRGDVSRLTAGTTLDLGRWLDWETCGPVMAEDEFEAA